MPYLPLWRRYSGKLPPLGVRFRTEEDYRYYYWQPCTCCGRPIVFNSDHRADVILTFLARGYDQGPHLTKIVTQVNDAVKDCGHYDELLYFAVDVLMADLEGRESRADYQDRPLMEERFPYLAWNGGKPS